MFVKRNKIQENTRQQNIRLPRSWNPKSKTRMLKRFILFSVIFLYPIIIAT